MVLLATTLSFPLARPEVGLKPSGIVLKRVFSPQNDCGGSRHHGLGGGHSLYLSLLLHLNPPVLMRLMRPSVQRYLTI